VPVGDDQRQHIEFARDVANSFNHLYGFVLPAPSAHICPSKRIMSLKDPHLKMSKSHTDPRSRILLTDSPEEIHQKIRLALTDSNPTVSYDPITRPGVSNLIEILCHIEGGGKPCGEFSLSHESLGLADLKKLVSEKVSEHLAPIQERYLEMMNSASDYLDSVAYEGGKAARVNADATMTLIKNAMGL